MHIIENEMHLLRFTEGNMSQNRIIKIYCFIFENKMCNIDKKCNEIQN